VHFYTRPTDLRQQAVMLSIGVSKKLSDLQHRRSFEHFYRCFTQMCKSYFARIICKALDVGPDPNPNPQSVFSELTFPYKRRKICVISFLNFKNFLV